jgi:cbb3-type cytochrome oxidase maturation protein
MTALAWLIPCALVLGLIGLVAFLWALNSGQFQDLEGAGWRAIQDDDDTPSDAPRSDKRSAPSP